ncbi:transglycosylase SLT domain-containing protein [Paenochrobactrum sp. BZR 588]|uniref:transglycosylase SLT domain-containing protein n=1 Tax=Paenochrobactrum TaxID=999488 RepID=UPI0035BC52DB
MMRILCLVALLILAGCASAPKQVNNACAIFDQRDGWINNWHGAAQKTSREFGVPIPVLMATIYTESSFRPYARPPRTKLLGFIPWKRQSTAYGFSQALNGTWDRYRRETGRSGASRSNFNDAIHFIGWYHYQSYKTNGIARNDAYNLYLAYHSGHGGYSRGVWRKSAVAKNGAKRTADMAKRYQVQLRSCGRLS